MKIKPYWLTLILALGATDRAYPSACSVPNATDGHTRFPVRTTPPLNPFSVPVTRIFGSGNAQHYMSDGQLLNLQQAIADGLIGPRAKLEYTISVTVAPGLYSSLYAFQQLGIVNSQLIGIPLAAASASGTSSEFARVQLSIQPKLNGASVGGKQAFSIPITPAGASASIRQCVSFDVAAISPRVGRLGAGPTEDPTPGANELTFDGNVSSVYVTISVRPVAIWIDGIAPSVLITGCCEEGSDFWSADDLVPPLRSLRAYFDEKRLPYDYVIPPGSVPPYLFGTVEPRVILPPPTQIDTQIPAALITDQGIRNVAKRFGAKWVNLIGHSKGGLNARLWMASNAASPNGPGPLSLITLDTPHRGSPFGDLIRTVVEDQVSADQGVILNKLLQVKLEQEYRSATMRDLGTEYLTTFNARYPPVSWVRIGSAAARPVNYWALASDANLNDSRGGDGRYRTISTNETRQITPLQFRGAAARVGAAAAFQDMHNLLGWATTVSITETRGWFGGTTSYARLNQGQAVFQRNDFVVTMVSQAFVYPRLPNFPIGIGAQGHNHNDVSDEPVAVGIHQALKTLVIP